VRLTGVSGSIAARARVWLQQQIAEQKRIDAVHVQVRPFLQSRRPPCYPRRTRDMPEVQLVLPGDAKKQRSRRKQMFLDRGAQPPFFAYTKGLTHGVFVPHSI